MKQKRGEYCGGVAPYGYIKDGKSFAIDEEVAPVVRQIFEWILDGYSDYAIVNKLNELKIMPPSRYRFEKGITKAKKHEETKFWYKSAVKRISENIAYTGVLAQGKQQSTFLKGGTYEFKSRDEWIIIENNHQAIIDKYTFETVRKIRDSRKEKHKTGSIDCDNIYKGLIFCSDCGAHMTRSKLYRVNGNNVYYFSCHTYRYVDKQACTKKKVMESELSEALFFLIKNQISLTVNINRIIQDLKKQASFHQRYNTLDKRVATLQKKLQQNHRFRRTLREDLQDGVISGQDYTAMRSDYDREHESLQQELETILSEKLRTDHTFSIENKWTNEFRKFETEQHISPQMVSTLIKRIYVSDNIKIDVMFHYRDEYQTLRDYIEGVEERVGIINE